jgi:hypothetical protein
MNPLSQPDLKALRERALTVRYCGSCLKEYGVLGACLHSDDPTWDEMVVIPLAALLVLNDGRKGDNDEPNSRDEARGRTARGE